MLVNSDEHPDEQRNRHDDAPGPLRKFSDHRDERDDPGDHRSRFDGEQHAEFPSFFPIP